MGIEDNRKSAYISNESMEIKEGATPYRDRPATVLGSDDELGLFNAIQEVISNSADEAREGFGDTIVIEVEIDGTLTVIDKGRGVPMAWNSKIKKFNYEVVFCTMYGSGKYGEKNYGKSEGLNGIGDTAAQFTSEFMDVVSIRDEATAFEVDEDGKSYPTAFERIKYSISFVKGYAVGELKSEKTDEETGTWIKFKPDLEVFKGAANALIPLNIYIDSLRRKAMLLPGVRFIIKYLALNPIELYFEHGARSFIDENCSKCLLEKSLYFEDTSRGQDSPEKNSPEYTLETKIAFNFSRETYFMETYHNGSHLTEGGESIEAFKSALCSVIEKHGRLSGKFGRVEKVQFKDVEEIVAAIVSTECPGYLTSFKHQTKTAINNKFIGKSVGMAVYRQFDVWATENKDAMAKIATSVALNKQAREKSEAVKKKALKELTASIDSMTGLPEKFKRCSSKDSTKTELYLVEGDSAKGSVVLARDKDYQAVMPLRGKPMNCLKEDLERILGSEIIKQVYRIFGCGIEAKSKYIKDLPEFDIKKLNFSKIIICTDADVDGEHIRTLIITMIYRLTPSLLKAGKVFIAETPLYEIKYGRGAGKVLYAYAINERDAMVAKLLEDGIKQSAISIKRMKGLGECDAATMSMTTMDPENRRLIQVEYPEDDTEFKVLMNSLMGDDIASRKRLIEAYFDEADNMR